MGESDTKSTGQDSSPRLDSDAVRALGRIAKLPMTPSRAATNVERLGSFLDLSDGWEGFGLAFSFEDGEFGYAQSIAQFRPEWDRATKLNKGRVVDPQPQAGEADAVGDGT